MARRLTALLLALVMVAGLLTACGDKKINNADPNATEVVIGGLAPLTGSLSVYGVACDQGIRLAIDEINANGGVLGKQVKYVKYDEKGDVTEAINAYNKLVQNDKIVALIGDVTSTPSISVAQKAAKDKIPMITATGTSADITAAGENVFRACFIDPFQGEIMASYASERLNAKTAAILYDISDDYSIGLTEAFKEKAESLGISIVKEEGYNANDVDFKSQLTNIKSSNADVLFIPVYYEAVALIVAQAKEVGVTSTLLGADGWDGVLDRLDASNVDAVESALFCNHYSPDDKTDTKLQEFIQNYKTAYNEDPNSFAALGYDAAYMLINSIEAAGSTEADAIIAQLKGINYQGVTGNIVLDENRNPIKRAAINTITGGEYKFVEYYEMPVEK